MGFTPRDASAVFLWQGGIVLLAGILLGSALGFLATYGISRIPLRIRGIFSTDSFVVNWDLSHHAWAALDLNPLRRRGQLDTRPAGGPHRARQDHKGNPVSTPSQAGSDPLLLVEGLQHSFTEAGERVRALRGVSFEARGGQVTAISGPSGCGKSTLLYLLGLLDRPEAGEIFLGGRPMAQADDDSRTALRNESIGFVFQFHFLIKELTARENVALPLRKAGSGEEEALEQVDRLLEQLGLGEKTERFANKLSGGEQQRVAIARARQTRPPCFLPTNLPKPRLGKLRKVFRAPFALCPRAGNRRPSGDAQP